MPYPNINKHQMFSAMFEPLWKKYHRWTRVGIEPTTSWFRDRRHTTRPPRLPDGYGWFDSHNSSRYCIDLSINDFRLGGFDYILKPMYSFGKWWKLKISLIGLVYRVISVLKALWIFWSETINVLRKMHNTNIFGMPPKILP